MPVPSPDTLLTNPLNISVVALPNILGPITENVTLPMANINTIIIDNLYLAK